MFGPVRLNLAQGAGGWLEGTLSLKVPISGPMATSGSLAAGSCRGSEGGLACPDVNFWCKSSHMTYSLTTGTPAGRAAPGLPGGPGASPRPGGGAHHVAIRAACRRDRGPGVAGHRRHGRLPAGPPRQGRQGAGPSRFTRTWPACSPTGPRPTVRGTWLSG